MKKKAPRIGPKGTTKKYEMVLITDPVEIAALERRIKKAEKALAVAALAAAKAKASPRK